LGVRVKDTIAVHLTYVLTNRQGFFNSCPVLVVTATRQPNQKNYHTFTISATMVALHYMALRKRVTFYMDSATFNKFRALLLLENKTASQWLRDRVKGYVKRHQPDDGKMAQAKD
jgi:hypothetical protein